MPTLPKAAWPPPQPRPPQRADASVLDNATAPLMATRAAMTRIILRIIGVSPSRSCYPCPTTPPRKRRAFHRTVGARPLRSARNLSIDSKAEHLSRRGQQVRLLNPLGATMPECQSHYDQFIRSQRHRILHFGSWLYLKVQYRVRFIAAYLDISDLQAGRFSTPGTG